MYILQLHSGLLYRAMHKIINNSHPVMYEYILIRVTSVNGIYCHIAKFYWVLNPPATYVAEIRGTEASADYDKANGVMFSQMPEHFKPNTIVTVGLNILSKSSFIIFEDGKRT